MTSPSASIVLRPTTSVLLGRLVLTTAAAVLAVAGWHFELKTLPSLFALFAVLGIFSIGSMAFGRVRADDDGLRLRSLLRTRTIPWSDVLQFVVHERPTHRYVYLQRPTGGGFRMPAPRSTRLIPDPAFDRDLALFLSWCAVRHPEAATRRSLGHPLRRWILAVVTVVAVLVAAAPDRPEGWIGSGGLSAAPAPCDLAPLFAADDPRQQVSNAADTLTVRSCTWDLRDDLQLLVVIQTFPRLGLHSATDEARYHADSIVHEALFDVIQWQSMADSYDTVTPADAGPVIGMAGTAVVMPAGLMVEVRIRNAVVVAVAVGSTDQARLRTIVKIAIQGAGDAITAS